MTDDLQALPTLSIVMPVEDIWGAAGILNNPAGGGMAWERGCSMEMLFPGAPSENYQEAAGLRIQGRWPAVCATSVRSPSGSHSAGSTAQGSSTSVTTAPVHQTGSTISCCAAATSIRGRCTPVALDRPDTSGAPPRCRHATFLRPRPTARWARTRSSAIGCTSISTASTGASTTPTSARTESFAALHLGGEDTDYDVLKQRPRGQANGSLPELVAGDRDEWNDLMALTSQNAANTARLQPDPHLYRPRPVHRLHPAQPLGGQSRLAAQQLVRDPQPSPGRAVYLLQLGLRRTSFSE